MLQCVYGYIRYNWLGRNGSRARRILLIIIWQNKEWLHLPGLEPPGRRPYGNWALSKKCLVLIYTPGGLVARCHCRNRKARLRAKEKIFKEEIILPRISQLPESTGDWLGTQKPIITIPEDAWERASFFMLQVFLALPSPQQQNGFPWVWRGGPKRLGSY